MATRSEVDSWIAAGSDVDKANLRAILKDGITDAYSDVASATTTDIGAAASQNVRITGTTTITGFGTVAAGTFRRLRFAGALTLTHNATSLIIPGEANITTVAGDRCDALSLGSGNWLVLNYVGATTTQAQTVIGGTTTGRALFVASDAAAGRSAISAPAIPIASSGAGQWVSLVSSLGGNLTLPASGAWAWFAISVVNASATISATGADVNSGGSVVLGSSAGIYHAGFCWRVS